MTSRWDSLRKSCKDCPPLPQKGTSPSAGLSETLQHTAELLLDGVVAVTTHHAIGNGLERGACISIAQPVPDKAE